jgi:hypothetical protein
MLSLPPGTCPGGENLRCGLAAGAAAGGRRRRMLAKGAFDKSRNNPMQQENRWCGLAADAAADGRRQRTRAGGFSTNRATTLCNRKTSSAAWGRTQPLVGGGNRRARGAFRQIAQQPHATENRRRGRGAHAAADGRRQRTRTGGLFDKSRNNPMQQRTAGAAGVRTQPRVGNHNGGAPAGERRMAGCNPPYAAAFTSATRRAASAPLILAISS